MPEINVSKQVNILLKAYTTWIQYVEYFSFCLIPVGSCTVPNATVTL